MEPILQKVKQGEKVTIYSMYDSFSGTFEKIEDGVLTLRINKKEIVTINIPSIYAVSRQG
jgi:preprotein translocase subunit YajC